MVESCPETFEAQKLSHQKNFILAFAIFLLDGHQRSPQNFRVGLFLL